MTIVYAALLLVGNAFFVAAEFALVASRRHRLELALADRPARAVAAALAGTRELPVMLAGAQLGITLCSLGLGALAEPAIAHGIEPILHRLGLPGLAGHAIAFVVALAVVTFLHLVIGEMMPKSWAITHPERSATLLALPFRAFTRVAGPALRSLNALANLLLRPFRVQPPDELAQRHGPAEMQMLFDRSRAEGLLEAEQSELLSSVLGLGSLRVHEVAFPASGLVTVPGTAGAADIELASITGGRSRLGVTGPDGALAGVVHVREALRATTAGRPATAADLMDPVFTLAPDDRVVDAVAAMRAGRAHLAMVVDGDRRVGFVALEDLLEQVIGRFDDETDPVPVLS